MTPFVLLSIPILSLIDQLACELVNAYPSSDVAAFTAVAEKHLPTMFSPDPRAANDAAFKFIIQVQELDGRSLPLQWFGLFRRAFDEGHISALTWGAIARMIYTDFGPAKGYAGEHHREFLDGFRVADQAGMMMRQELRAYCSLPKVVTIYRGAVAIDMAQAAQGISWSLSRHYATIHVFRRKVHNHLHDELLRNALTARPRLITATVPLDAIFAYLSVPGDEEVLVDYELIDRATLRELPMPSDATVLANGVMFGKAGKGGLGNSFGMNPLR
jgi:hypothetical protein